MEEETWLHRADNCLLQYKNTSLHENMSSFSLESTAYLDLGVGCSIFLILCSIGRRIDVDAVISNVLTDLSRRGGRRGEERRGRRKGRGEEGERIRV